MTVGHPLTRQRSDWEAVTGTNRPGQVLEALLTATSGDKHTVYRRNVSDGVLAAIVAHEPEGWHLSISFRDHRGRKTRYPRWDEIADARYRLCPADIEMVMHLPPPDVYVAFHDTTFHLHELRESKP